MNQISEQLNNYLTTLHKYNKTKVNYAYIIKSIFPDYPDIKWLVFIKGNNLVIEGELLSKTRATIDIPREVCREDLVPENVNLVNFEVNETFAYKIHLSVIRYHTDYFCYIVRNGFEYISNRFDKLIVERANL